MSDTKLPLLILLLAWLFILVGIVGIAYHAKEFNPGNPFESELLLGLFIRLLAIAGGVLLLRGFGWARWILIFWTVYHVVIGAMHGLGQLVLHVIVLGVVAYILLRPASSDYFTGREPR